MRIFKILTATVLAFIIGCGAAPAAIVILEFTVIFAGGWSGNYDPITHHPIPGSHSSGSYSAKPFALQFSFDTDLAQPGYFDNQRLDTERASPLDIRYTPSIGFVIFTSSLFALTSGNSTASDIISNDTLSQFARSVETHRAGPYTSTMVT
jgi:hypothetical protein